MRLPSTKIRGALFPFVVIPLILMLRPAPGDPDCELIFTPAICPCKACSVRTGFSFSMAFAPKTLTAPVTSFLRCVPYPTTTISSSASATADNVIVKLVLLFTATSCVSYPMYEITRIASLETLSNWNKPSKSVVVPLVVPFTKTVAPGSGMPLSASVMVPPNC